MPHGTVVPFLPPIEAAEDKRPKGAPLAQLIEFHRTLRLPELAENTRSGYRQTYQLLAALRHPHPSVSEFTRWVAWLKSLYPPPPGFSDSSTVHLHWRYARAIYKWNNDQGNAWGCNPAACVKLPKVRPRARATVNIVDFWPTILDACRDLRERTFLQLALDTGARKGELLGLMPEDLVTTCEPWCLNFGRQRPNANRWGVTPLKVIGGNKAIPLVSPETRAMLAELIAIGPPKVWVGRGRQELVSSEFLFPYRTNDVMSLRRRCGAVAPSVFPRGDWLHTLRHTFAVLLNRSGATDEEVQHALGHRSLQSTLEVYVNEFHRGVDAAPLARMMAARRLGVTKWGAPPGRGTGPPGMVPSGPQKRTAPAGTGAVQERSREQVTRSKETAPCRTPSQKQRAASTVKRIGSAPAATRGKSTTSKASAASSPARAKGSTGQRALPGLAAVAVTTRPARAALPTPGKARRRR